MKGRGLTVSIPDPVWKAVCGDPALARIYRLTEKSYERLKSNPAAFDIMLTLLRARQACIRWKPGEPFKACIMRAERTALAAYGALELKPRGKKATRKHSPHKSGISRPTLQ